MFDDPKLMQWEVPAVKFDGDFRDHLVQPSCLQMKKRRERSSTTCPSSHGNQRKANTDLQNPSLESLPQNEPHPINMTLTDQDPEWVLLSEIRHLRWSNTEPIPLLLSKGNGSGASLCVQWLRLHVFPRFPGFDPCSGQKKKFFLIF